MSSRPNSAYPSESFLRMSVRSDADRRERNRRAASASARQLPPTSEAIWGQYNNYRANGVVLSAIVHIAIIGLLVSGVFVSHQITQHQTHDTVTLIAPSLDAYALPTSNKEISGGGGGGSHGVVPAPKGHPPKVALKEITPPAIVVHNENPRLPVQPTVVAPPALHLAENHMPTIGVPAPAVMPSAPPSSGIGSGGGIGSGSGGGVGIGHGAGVGAGTGAGIGGGVYHVGEGISAPTAISAPDPDYTEEARRGKKQGTCVLWLIVDSAGHPQDIHVEHGLGYGLDAKAVEAVKQWRFQPAMKDGKAVAVEISVEVEFHLY